MSEIDNLARMEKKFPELNEKQLRTLRKLLLDQADRGKWDNGGNAVDEVLATIINYKKYLLRIS